MPIEAQGSRLVVGEPQPQHTPGLAHHFDSLGQQRDAMTLGMWAFLASEVMFFGGLLTVYAVYRWQEPEIFKAASHHLNPIHGGINTAVLLGSSLTMVLAVHAAVERKRKAMVGFLALTMLLGSIFLGVKFSEYYHKYEEGLVPAGGLEFRYEAQDPRDIPKAKLFFGLYFVMTGIHALHMLIGIGVMGVLAIAGWRGRYHDDYMPIEVAGLYWHFVDLVWIFLFPFLYLIDRSG